MALWLYNMYLQLGFVPEAEQLLVREQGLEGPDRLLVFTDKNIDNVCNS